MLLRINKGRRRSPAALLFVCRQLYEDYAQLFYSINTFALHSPHHSIRSTIFQFQESIGSQNAAALRDVIAIRHLGTFALEFRRRRYITSCAEDFNVGFCGTLFEAPIAARYCRGFEQERSFEVEFRMDLVATSKATAWVRVQLTETKGRLYYEYKEVRLETRKTGRPEVTLQLFLYEIETTVRVWCESYQYCQKCFGLVKIPFENHQCPKFLNIWD